MQAILNCVISKATQSTKYPDTCYLNLVDLGSGQPFEASTRKMHANAFAPVLKKAVELKVDLAVLPRRSGGGHSVIFEEITFPGAAPKP